MGQKHVFRVNLTQIRSAVPEIFHTQLKTQTDGAKTEPSTAHYALKITTKDCVIAFSNIGNFSTDRDDVLQLDVWRLFLTAVFSIT